MAPDAVAEAVAAAEAPKPEQRAALQVQLRSGRVVALNVPVDLQAAEAVELIGFVATALPAELAKMGQHRPTLLVPTGMRLPRA